MERRGPLDVWSFGTGIALRAIVSSHSHLRLSREFRPFRRDIVCILCLRDTI